MEKEPLSLLQYMCGNRYIQIIALCVVLAVVGGLGYFGDSTGERAWSAVALLAIAVVTFYFARRSYLKFYLPAANRRK